VKYQAIIFDKDGTLIDFDAFWVNISTEAISDVLCSCGYVGISVEEILERYGVHNGETSVEGILCKGTYAQMGQIVCDVLKEHGYQPEADAIIKLVTDMHIKHMDAGKVVSTCPDLPGVMKRLKVLGLKLAVVTTDNRQMTMKCLSELGVTEFFDVIYTDDGTIPTKPDSACAEDFCRRFDLEKERILMVGDTLTDVAFAKNTGISMIAVAKRKENRDLLLKHTDVVLPDVSYLEENI
jgi:phosphoglycolate phosphatase